VVNGSEMKVIEVNIVVLTGGGNEVNVSPRADLRDINS
jgi:hypothetical protein